MRTKRLATLLSVLLVLIITGWAFMDHGRNSSPKAGDKPTPDVISVVTKYLAAEENSVGANQTSPTSWLVEAKAITTSGWFDKLQPDPNTTTSNVPAQYYIAHSKGYIVKVNVSNCIWTSAPAKDNPSSGNVFCSLSDITVDKTTGKEIPVSALPFGWTHSGQQSQHNLYLLKQNKVWIIDNDVVSG